MKEGLDYAILKSLPAGEKIRLIKKIDLESALKIAYTQGIKDCVGVEFEDDDFPPHSPVTEDENYLFDF